MNWGSVPDWVMAVLTGAGFTGAVLQLRLNQRDSRAARDRAWQEERDSREAMARAVAVKSSWRPGPDAGPPPGAGGLMPVDVEVTNAGPYPIRNVVLLLSTDDEDHPMEVVYGTVLPGEHLQDTYEVSRAEVVFGELTGGTTLLFTDTWDNHWSSSTSWTGLERREGPARVC